MPVQILNDRHGRPLKLGQLVEIQRCVGRYGQTQKVKGVIKQLDLTEPTTMHLRDHNKPVPAGKLFSLSLPGEFRSADQSWSCFYRSDDFEHGHEAWVEIVQ